MTQQEEVELDLCQAMSAISKVAEQHDQKQMGRIAQIDKIITEGRLFAKNCTQIFKLEAIKFRLQKVIAAKREKANNSRLLEQELEGHFRKYQSMKLIEAHAGPAVEWTRKGSSVQWIRGQSPCKE